MWRKLEDKTAKEFKGRRHAGSGNRWYNPGDVSNDKYLIENKATARESFSISVKLWEKIEREALLSRRIPLLSIELGDGKQELIVMSMEDFCSLK